MLSAKTPKPGTVALDPLDRAALGYLCLPLLIFLAGWLKFWPAVLLLACAAYALRSVVGSRNTGGTQLPVSAVQVAMAVALGCAWTYFVGIGHLIFTNADWHVRDAVLHDLVASSWPVGYGPLDGHESILRAPIAYYLPAALVGKCAGLMAANFALAAWTAAGASLFLLQAMSMAPRRAGIALLIAVIVILFSGFDIVGSLLNDGPHFRRNWNITTHLEWWAGSYQYSSMTTQLFWVPNHALGGWILIGMVCREERTKSLGEVLPIAVVALALWSPLTALGVVPFVLWAVLPGMVRERSTSMLHPKVWTPALAVGLVTAAYLVLDPGQIPKGLAMGGGVADAGMTVLRQAQFFLLEAGLLGAAILAIQTSPRVIIALAVLAVLPLIRFGPGNDFVMRTSIPSIAALAIGAGLALIAKTEDPKAGRKKLLLSVLLAIGAVTAVAEFARAIVLPAWPLNTHATLIGASCGGYAPHYVARMDHQLITRVLREPHRIPLGDLGRDSCFNPAIELMWGGQLL